MMAMTKKKILFLCTGNSCRSQMAEGWANALGGDVLEAQSAGIVAHGQNPRAIAVMQDAGVDITHQQSTVVTDAMVDNADIVITVCGHADEMCPTLPPGTVKHHWPLADPARAQGSEEQIMAVFSATRDEISRRVSELVNELRSQQS